MKKLHSFVFYALVTPTIALSSAAVLAEQSYGQDTEQKQQTAQPGQDATKSAAKTAPADQKMSDQAATKSQGSMGSDPAKGMQVSSLIGAEVKNTADEGIGSVSDLIIDRNGQVLAIVVGVGGFLGMGEKNVAVGWDEVTISGTADKQELRTDMTREELQSASEFKAKE